MEKGEAIKAMTPEQLLKPRYKVIADFPAQHYSIGDVIDTDNPQLCSVCEDEFWLFNLDKYPAIFKKLQWWEEREASEIESIRYMKYEKSHHYPTGTIVKVFEWQDGRKTTGWWFRESSADFYNRYIGDYTPATETEYNQYISKTQTQEQ